MRFRHELSYDAPPDRVFEMLADPAFREASCTAIQREEWRSLAEGELRIESPGKPAGAVGTIRLEPAGTGTTEVVELEIKVKVPPIGGRLERLMAEKVAAGMDVEHGIGVAWLKEH